MADTIDFRKFGGIPVLVAGAKLRDALNDPAAVVWNFGVAGKPGIPGPTVASNAPYFNDVAPRLVGKWDGKTTICPHDACRKVLGKDMPAQQQPKGTCGGRTGKMAGQLAQCVMIAAGIQDAVYKPISHAWPYALARMEYGMLGSGDGVPDGSIGPVLVKYGYLNAEEAGDTNDYGQGSDDLAAKWGGRSGPPRAMFEAAADNKVEATLVRVRTVQEYADAAMAGGIGLVSSMRGFSMTRDNRGVCRAQGEWSHYMTTSGIAVIDPSYVVIPIDQSWGRNTPTGPKLMDGRWPDHCFGAETNVVERDMMQAGTMHMLFKYPLWDVKTTINWRKVA